MQEVLTETLSSLTILTLGTLLGFAVSVFIARNLGVEGTGVYYLALSVATIAATIARLGFDNTVVRFAAAHAASNEWNSVHFVHRAVTRVVRVSSLVVSFALIIAAPWMADKVFNKPDLKIPLLLAGATVVPAALAMIDAEALRGIKSIPFSQWIKSVQVSLGTLVILYPFSALWGINGAVAAYAVAAVLAAVAARMCWSKAYREASVHSTETHGRQRTSVRSLFRSSWPLFCVALTGLVIQQVATLMLGIWGTTADVGIFNVANRVSGLLLFPLMAMISILSPKIAAFYRQNDIENMSKLARRSSLALTIIAVPLAGTVFGVAQIIMTMFGPDFKAGGSILRILLVGVVVNAATGAVANLLMMTGYEKTVRDVTIGSAIVTAALGVALIPVYSTIGAAIAVTCGVVVQNALMTIMVKNRLGFWPIGLQTREGKSV